MSISISKAQEIFEIVAKRKIIIYGAGFVADFFYRLLCKKGLDGSVICFMVSENGGVFNSNIPIISIKRNEINRDSFVCISVHEASLGEIEDNLRSYGFTDYLWIYPYIYEMWLGEPIQVGVDISIRRIWEKKKDKYYIASRYLAIEQYYNKNDIGYDLYKKSLVLPKDKCTINKRLERFIRLIKNWEEQGYDKKQSIRVMDDYTIMDGNHRLTAAIYFGIDLIHSNIYSIDNKIDLEMVPPERKLYPENLKLLGFTEDEIAIMDRTIEKIDFKLKRNNNKKYAKY